MLYFLKSFFTFNFATLFGLITGLWLYSMHSERKPLSSFLTEPSLYLILFIMVFGFRLIVWLLMDKAALAGIGKLIKNVISETIILTLATLSCVGFLFLVNTFVLKYL